MTNPPQHPAETPTPKTDAEALVLGGTVDSHLTRYRNMGYFARSLERELAAQRATIARLQEALERVKKSQAMQGDLTTLETVRTALTRKVGSK